MSQTSRRFGLRVLEGSTRRSWRNMLGTFRLIIRNWIKKIILIMCCHGLLCSLICIVIKLCWFLNLIQYCSVPFHHRNAAVEGYIQQFLYTYRFLCTPEQLLQFIMDRFISAARYCTSSSSWLHRETALYSMPRKPARISSPAFLVNYKT